jgi:hypothetical protein
MPTSRSPKQSAKPAAQPQRPHFVRLFAVMAVVVVLVVGVIALPASLLKRFLPAAIQAEDFSGSLWHGSAGRMAVNGRDAGALEWHLHPWSLFTLTLSADLRWVKVGFVADARVDADRHGLSVHDAEGGGPIEDLSDLGVAAGWHGTSQFKFSELKLGLANGSMNLLSAVGELSVADLTSPQIASGADLGGYALRSANGAITPDADATAELTDTGGPLEVRATIHFSAKDHTGLLSGTIKDRPGAPPPLRNQMEQLAQLHARDAQGRIPVDLEFTL